MKITTLLLCLMFMLSCSNYGDKSAAHVDSLNTGDTPMMDVNNGSAVVPEATKPVTDTAAIPGDTTEIQK